MKKQLLIYAVMAMASAAASAAPFEWDPAISQPNPVVDVTQAWQAATVRFTVTGIEGVKKTDVMPVWIDEDENSITAFTGDETWNKGEFEYYFNIDDFKSNGEYLLRLPEGLLVNAAGDPSAEVEFPYTFVVPELAGAMFDDFKVLSISPDLNEPQAVWNDQVITINTNHNDAIGLTKLTITDSTEGGVVVTSSNFSTGRVPGDTAPITWEVANKYEFYEDHDYVAVIEFYNGKDEYGELGATPKVDVIEYHFTGRVVGFKYSKLTLESVFPEPYSMIAEPSDAVFTYTFSGPVTCYNPQTPMGSAGIHDYLDCLSSNEDKTVWTLDLSQDEFIRSIDTEVVINLYARDEEGFQLKGNIGKDAESCFQYSWACELGAFPIEAVVPEMDATVDELTEIVVRQANGDPMAVSWNGQVTVWGMDRQYYGTLYYDLPWDATETSFTEFRFTQWENAEGVLEPISLKKAGYYVITFPSGYFNTGEQYEAKVSHSLNIRFEISGTLDDTPDDPAEQEVFEYERVSPESGSTVASLSMIQLWYPDAVDTMGKDASVYDSNGNLVTKASVSYSWDDLNLAEVSLFNKLTVAGDYTVVVPARTICTSEFFYTDGRDGICNPEFTLSFTVDGSEADPQEALRYAIASPAAGSTLEALDEILLTFDEPVGCDDFEVSVINSMFEPVATGVGRTDFSDPTMVVVTLNEPIADSGIYNVVIPARVIFNGDWYESDGAEGLCNPEYNLYYTVGGSDVPGIDPAEQEVFDYIDVDPADGSEVKELSHISLWFPDMVMIRDNVAYVFKADALDSDPVALAKVDFDWEDDFLINVDLAEAITEVGEYVVVIPARTICEATFFDSNGMEGFCNPEIRLTYTVKPDGSAVASVAAEKSGIVYDVNGRIVLRDASAADIKKLDKGIYIVGGRKIVIR